ncbi:MAG: S41 family peptidase [Acidobacteriota bacterium]
MTPHPNSLSRRPSFAALLATALLFSGPLVAEELPPLQVAPLDPAFEGTWRARGYGQMIQAGDGTIRLYDVTESYCAQDVSIGDPPAIPLFAAVDKDSMRLSLRATGSTVYTYDRVETLPETCGTQHPSDPQTVFDVFAENMAEHYTFFDLYEVDWAERVAAGRKRIRKDMSDDELFSVLEASLEGLGDAHLGLLAEIDGDVRRYSGRRSTLGYKLDAAQAKAGVADQDVFQQKWRKRQRKELRRLLGKSLETGADDQITWGRLGEGGKVGYLRVEGMGGFADADESYEGEIAGVKQWVGRVLRDLSDTETLIVDVSLNGGGMDEVSLAIAGHFADERTFVYSKSALGAEGVPAQKIYVEPLGKRYSKPVTLLTSHVTVSAAETFTMAMRALPTVTHRGEATRGALSDVLEKVLPNGWSLRMSNETYLDAEGELWEGRGVIPEEEIEVFREATIDTSHADVLRELAARLSND